MWEVPSLDKKSEKHDRSTCQVCLRYQMVQWWKKCNRYLEIRFMVFDYGKSCLYVGSINDLFIGVCASKDVKWFYVLTFKWQSF